MSIELESLGLNPVLPKVAERMKLKSGENLEAMTDWINNPEGYHAKAVFIREHFDAVAASDAILVANYEKHGKANYIGPNVLLEMGLAFHLKKPIYVLFGCPEESPFKDEILGLEPIFLQGKLTSILA